METTVSSTGSFRVFEIDRGPHRGLYGYELNIPPAYVLAKNAATPRQYRRKGIAPTRAHAVLTAKRQLRVHAEAAQ